MMVSAKRAAAAEQIAEAAEERAAERPADEKRGLDVGGIFPSRPDRRRS